MNEWIDESNMTKDERKENPYFVTIGGYLRTQSYKEAFTASMKKATPEEIEQIKALPNFDADIFEEISGFRIK